MPLGHFEYCFSPLEDPILRMPDRVRYVEESRGFAFVPATAPIWGPAHSYSDLMGMSQVIRKDQRLWLSATKAYADASPDGYLDWWLYFRTGDSIGRHPILLAYRHSRRFGFSKYSVVDAYTRMRIVASKSDVLPQPHDLAVWRVYSRWLNDPSTCEPVTVWDFSDPDDVVRP